jgi:hypothetical protein
MSFVLRIAETSFDLLHRDERIRHRLAMAGSRYDAS